MKLLKFSATLVLASLPGAAILYAACYTPSFIELRWLILLYPAPLVCVFVGVSGLSELKVPILVGLALPFLMLLETRFPVVEASIAEKIGGPWPYNYEELRYQWRYRAYWLLDFWLVQRKFEPGPWKQATPDSNWPVRLHMSDSLVQDSILDGLHSNQVHALLGPPSEDLEPRIPVCNLDGTGDSSTETYHLVSVNNFEYSLVLEYSEDTILCAYQGLRIIF